MKNIEAEKDELVLQNESGTYAIIPANKREEVKRLLSEGCYDCIDRIVESLPKASDYAEGGTVIDPPAGLEEMLKEYNSPMTVDDFVYVSRDTGIGVDALVTQALLESSLGTKGKGAKGKNPLNWGNDDEGNIRTYNSYREGLLTAAKGLKEKFYFTTPEDFIERNFQGRYGIYATDPQYKQKYSKYLNIVRDRLNVQQQEDAKPEEQFVQPESPQQDIQPKEQVIEQEQETVSTPQVQQIQITGKPQISSMPQITGGYVAKEKIKATPELIQLKEMFQQQGFMEDSIDPSTLMIALDENRISKYTDFNKLAQQLNSI